MDGFLVVKGGSIGVVPGKKIIRAREYAVLTEASAIIEEARREAARLLEEAKAAAHAMREEGYRRGVREGQQKIAEKMLETVQRTVDYVASSEETICNLVINAVRRVIGEFDNRDLVVRIVRHALAMVRSQKRVVVKVAPQEREVVQKRIEDIMTQFPGIEFIEVTSDPRLPAGSCILESEMGIVDASIEVQLQAIQRALMKTIQKVV